jgi:hypothetical protein
MKKVSSPVEIYRIFKDGTMIKIPANGGVVCDDEKALEIKSIYPFVRVENVVDEKEVEDETIVEQGKEKVKQIKEQAEEQIEEQAKKQEKKSKRGRKSKGQK